MMGSNIGADPDNSNKLQGQQRQSDQNPHVFFKDNQWNQFTNPFDQIRYVKIDNTNYMPDMDVLDP